MHLPSRIVIAEPDRDRRARLAAALAREGVTVDEASDGVALLRHLEHLAAVHGVREADATIATRACAAVVNPELLDAGDVAAAVARARWRIPMLVLGRAADDAVVVGETLDLVRHDPPRLRFR